MIQLFPRLINLLSVAQDSLGRKSSPKHTDTETRTPKKAWGLSATGASVSKAPGAVTSQMPIEGMCFKVGLGGDERRMNAAVVISLEIAFENRRFVNKQSRVGCTIDRSTYGPSDGHNHS